MTTLEILRAARGAKNALMLADSDRKNRALLAMADALERSCPAILAANGQDLENARGTVPDVMLDRLRLNEERVAGMARGIREASALPDPVGRVRSEETRPNGLLLQKVTVPMGVIAIIYESRPNVTSDA